MRPITTVLVLLLAVTACGGQPTATAQPPTPTLAQVAPTATPDPPSPTVPPPSPTPDAPSPTPVPPTIAPSPTSPPATATPVPPRRFVVQRDGSRLTLRVSETFARIRTPSDAVLTTDALSGQLAIGPDGRFGPESRVVLDLSTLQSDDSDRDDDVKENYLETAKFRDGVFVPKEFRGLPNPAPTSGSIAGQLVGDLTIHGVTKPVTFDVTGNLDAGSFRGKARTEVKITDFGMKVPSLAILLRVEDHVRTEVDLVATEQRSG